jgi:hypothetical protein
MRDIVRLCVDVRGGHEITELEKKAIYSETLMKIFEEKCPADSCVL